MRVVELQTLTPVTLNGHIVTKGFAEEFRSRLVVEIEGKLLVAEVTNSLEEVDLMCCQEPRMAWAIEFALRQKILKFVNDELFVRHAH